MKFFNHTMLDCKKDLSIDPDYKDLPKQSELCPTTTPF